MTRRRATFALVFALVLSTASVAAGSADTSTSAEPRIPLVRPLEQEPVSTTTLPPPPTTTTTAPPAPPTTQATASQGDGDPYNVASWYRLYECENGGYGWSANTGNGYYGGLQFSLASWHAVGGVGSPHEASPDEQIHRGQLLWEQGGWSHWPACTAKFGWR